MRGLLALLSEGCSEPNRFYVLQLDPTPQTCFPDNQNLVIHVDVGPSFDEVLNHPVLSAHIILLLEPVDLAFGDLSASVVSS